ncbi:dnaJ homolog subfamily B member 13 isoform 1-T1 [Menidia menidia]
MSQDYYETLELNWKATDADIKKAYRRLSLKFHPRRNRENDTLEKFTQLGEAYDVLSDPRKKATYEKFGEEGLKGGIPAEFGSGGAWSSKYVYHGDPDKTFREFFGGDNPFADFYSNDAPLQFGGLQPDLVKTRDAPIERDLNLCLDDLFHGCTKKIKISRRVMNDDGHTSSIKDKILSINVKPGWKEGTRIVFSKEGDQGPNSIPADIVFIVRQKTHPQFVRRGNDLVFKAKISLEMVKIIYERLRVFVLSQQSCKAYKVIFSFQQALTGFSVDIQTLDGRLLSIPINDIVHPAYKKVLSGEGMPLSQDPSQRGNLIVIFDVQFPDKLSAESKLLIREALAI